MLHLDDPDRDVNGYSERSHSGGLHGAWPWPHMNFGVHSCIYKFLA